MRGAGRRAATAVGSSAIRRPHPAAGRRRDEIVASARRPARWRPASGQRHVLDAIVLVARSRRRDAEVDRLHVSVMAGRGQALARRKADSGATRRTPSRKLSPRRTERAHVRRTRRMIAAVAQRQSLQRDDVRDGGGDLWPTASSRAGPGRARRTRAVASHPQARRRSSSRRSKRARRSDVLSQLPCAAISSLCPSVRRQSSSSIGRRRGIMPTRRRRSRLCRWDGDRAR